MSTGRKHKGENGQEVEKILIAVGKMLMVLLGILREGIRRVVERFSWEWQLVIALYALSCFGAGYHYYHLRLWHKLWPSLDAMRIVAEWGRVANGLATMVAFTGLVLFICGFIPYCRLSKMKMALDRLGIKAGMDCRPKLLKVAQLTAYRTKLTLQGQGIGRDHYQKRIGDIEAAFNATVESIRKGGGPQFVEIVLTTKAMPKLCHYQETKGSIAKDYSFVVGEGLNGVITKSILDFPGGHLLIAGVSGGGKSTWFKGCLLSLLETSPHAEFFLLDFKGGVEFAPFKQFPNVSVEKDMQGALRKLRMVVQEMNRRFAHLERVEKAFILPQRDKMNHLFIAVDESSLLYGQVPRTDGDFEYVMEARKLTNDIAKRGRAACISLILATQKVTKETIGTSIQENITGRICFRMNTLQGSMIVLGNKLAMELPDTPGRAVWQCGNEKTEVQAPLFSEDDLKAAIKGYGEGEFFELLGQGQRPIEDSGNDFLQKLKNQMEDQ